jgi:uncharacterized membrane protein YhaH (DUF805 family)
VSNTTNQFFLANRDAINRYADFSGTTSRSQYWIFIFSVNASTFLAAAIAGALISNVLLIFFIVPTISAGVRRLHDVGKSGWLLLIPIVNLILLASPRKV